MAKTVRNNECEHGAMQRKDHSPKVRISQRAGRPAIRGNGASSHIAQLAYPSAVTLPVTHLMAGTAIRVPKSIKTMYGIGDYPIDGGLLKSADALEGVISAGVRHEWISTDAVEHMLSSFRTASPEQSRAAFSLANEALNRIDERLGQLTNRSKDSLEKHKTSINGERATVALSEHSSSWENVLCPATYDDETISEFDVNRTGLIASESGLCVMFSEICSETDDVLAQQIAQFVHFCCELSFHASSIDMVLDGGMKWMTIGEFADLKPQDEKALSRAAHDEEDLLQTLREIMGDDIEDEMYISVETLADYYRSVQRANELKKKIKPLSKSNVKSFLREIKLNELTPRWLIVATETLLENCDWTINLKNYVEFTGHIPFEFTKPFACGLPIEEHLFTSLHETFMHGEEALVSMSVPFCKETPQILANLDLGERLLMFVNEVLYPEVPEEV
ncbi:MAG: hypothetical protein EOO52_13200 [Gammaproteobacteria bacterium]|nr:MAG: hypothetical protein EOO52_13200 [Gammaproteobacteria bacterium]